MTNQKKTVGCGTFILTWIIVAVFLGVFFNAINKTGQSVGSIVAISIFIGFLIAFIIMAFKMVMRSSKISKNAKKNMRNQKQINSASGNGTFSHQPSVIPLANADHQEMPQKILRDTRIDYARRQAINDMRIIQESLAIMEKTSDIDTFLSRYETAMRCALTLEQAKKAGQKLTIPDGYSQSLLSAKSKALAGVLYRSFKKELDEINKLKTASGKLNRINRYQEKLRGIYETQIQFIADEAYSDIMQKLDFLKNG